MLGKFRLSLGARYLGDGRTHFRVWAPDRKRVEVALFADERVRAFPLERGADGYFEGVHPVPAGTRYRYKLDGGEAFPDPCSRFQPEGPHGPSEVVDPKTFRWTDQGFPGRVLKGDVVYELHVGAFTREGTYAALVGELAELKALGVTTLELMPVNTFPGRFNWGYDGVSLFAPCAVYGTPDDLRHLVNEAHRLGLAVILDVVYNHLGPDGNYLKQYAKDYFTDRYPNEWGECLNFDGPNARAVRDFFVQNAAYWISEFHFDGLRLDATQSLKDASPRHIVADVAAAARAAAGGKPIVLYAENEPQDVRYVLPPEQGGHGVDAIWVDDFHHAARVAVGGRAEAYLQDYRGSAQELLACARHNALFQGQYYTWQKEHRGSNLLHTPGPQAVFFLQNHDQVANHLTGERLHQLGGLACARALTTYFLLLPQTPLLFMGQEFFAENPFVYFTDHPAPLQELVRKGRSEFLAQFPTARAALEEGYRLPMGEDALALSRLDLSERQKHPGPYLLHKELLRLRREDPVFSRQDRSRIDGSVLSSRALVLRCFGLPDQKDRLVLLNLGADHTVEPCPEPLLAPPAECSWRPILSSEEIRFGGAGAVSPLTDRGWRLPGHCAVVLVAEEKARDHAVDPAP